MSDCLLGIDDGESENYNNNNNSDDELPAHQQRRRDQPIASIYSRSLLLRSDSYQTQQPQVPVKCLILELPE